ncbi:survival motor neuron protein [Culicoides brevitarsis]|uniref:survival motor neuron protein n=1 Tax=Culicoides brevitarsis TaxID=469753 RepID=UPI00307C2F7C
MPNSMENSKEKQNDLWDDTLIIKAYEESMKLAKEEVAKRLANATNKSTKKSVESPGSSKQPAQPKDFKVGEFCRATYEDGVDYEAKIMAVDSNGKFTIRYIGYENEEYKEKSELLPSWGKKARKQQKFEAKQAGNVAEDGSESGVSMEHDFGAGQVLFERQKAGKAQAKSSGGVFFPPPPPMPPMLDENLEDAEHLSAMLMSWYMSGYYTGLYQGQKMAAAQKRKGH